MTKAPFDPADLVSDAKALAAEHHAGQTDKLGIEYIAHVTDVADRVRGEGPAIEAIAWLHDVVEDTEVTLAEIEESFGKAIRDGVDAMTHREDEDYFEDYLPRLAANPNAVLVKIADASHNWGKVHLLKGADPDRAAGLDRKYRRVLEFLGQGTAVCRRIVFKDEIWVPCG